MRITSTLLAAALACGAFPALAQGDVEAGRALAEENCARCHDIEPGGAMKTMPPSFASIAAFRTADEITGRIWFPPMHSRMPPMHMILTPQDVDSLTDYIVSLEAAE
ncbi:cytochrome c [Ostreiculturibacter nitratireducens]|uniref:c-type cytochrome n=1 Tax=Ostreiculturibacter nitratireducens TaxID=3075226 RepID=UPI0031B5E499